MPANPEANAVIMRASVTRRSVEQQADAIASRRNLLAYIRSAPQRLSIESYLCLTRILNQGGWRYDQQCWLKGDQRLSTLEAAAVELERQLGAERDQLLRQTVGTYAP